MYSASVRVFSRVAVLKGIELLLRVTYRNTWEYLVGNKNFKDVLFLRFFDRGFAVRPASHVPTTAVKYTRGFERYPFYFTGSRKAQNVKEEFKEYETCVHAVLILKILKTRCNVCEQ